MWRRVRKAAISQSDRDLFERYGETVVALLLANHMSSYSTKTVGFHEVLVSEEAATAWLTERGDTRERQEQRLETVEWAVLIFVAVGVVADIFLLLHH
jgi:hypothetical protein